MIRASLLSSLLLWLLLQLPALARGGSAGNAEERFDLLRAAGVYTSALTFMGPRILEPVAVPQLIAWGLSGIAAIDPRLRAEVRDGRLRLRLIGPDRREHVLLLRPTPNATDTSAWARETAEIQEAAYNVSPLLRTAGSGAIVRGFFDEMFNHLDPYSRYSPPEEAEDGRTRRAGQAGVGITVASRAGQIVVATAPADGPAAVEGVRAGDALLSIDGKNTRGRDVATLLGWLRGPEDTSVSVSWRGRDGETRSADLTRTLIPPETVQGELQGSVLVLRVSDFNNATGLRVGNVIELQLHESGTTSTPSQPMLSGIIIDLRGNRGGVLRQAVIAADTILPPGVIATTQGRYPDASRILRSTTGDLVPFLPVVVIVDGRTASAAEVLAAALADRGRAVVVGSATLGKGLVQTIAQLPDGGELRVTWSRIIAPRGWPIQTLGVMPQICTSLSAEALTRQLEELSAGRAPMAAALDRHHATRPPLTAQQALALRAPCPAAEGREADMRVAHLLIENPANYAAALLPPMRNAAAATRP